MSLQDGGSPVRPPDPPHSLPRTRRSFVGFLTILLDKQDIYTFLEAFESTKSVLFNQALAD